MLLTSSEEHLTLIWFSSHYNLPMRWFENEFSLESNKNSFFLFSALFSNIASNGYQMVSSTSNVPRPIADLVQVSADSIIMCIHADFDLSLITVKWRLNIYVYISGFDLITTVPSNKNVVESVWFTLLLNASNMSCFEILGPYLLNVNKVRLLE